MKKYFKKISALLMAAIMVLTMCATVFAADKPVGVTIKGIKNEAGVTVTAYKIVNINDNGSYEPFLDGSITTNGGEEFTITSEQILALAKRTNELTENTPITTKVGDDYKADLGFGTWMILVTGSEDVLYNPAVVSVGKDAAGNKVYGTLDFSNSSWTDASGVIYMKKSEPTITKTAAPANTGDTAVVGTQCGDIIKYTINADIPSYASNETNIVYSINDTLDGLSLVADEGHVASATVGGAKDDTLTANVKAAIKDGERSFTVTGFDDAWILAHRGERIEITYFAKVTSDAKYSVDLNTNTATLSYSANGDTQTKSSKTQHYTFGIDTSINGTVGQGTPSKTGEFIKINADGEVSYDEKTGEVTKTENTELLSGAEFQLHIGSATGPLFTDAKGNSTFTTVDGRLEINGLDSDIEYYLVETKAPTGYKLLATPIKVKIDAEFTGDVLTGYTVNIGDKGTHYTYNETAGTTTLVNDEDHPSNPFGFTNTKLGELPSTGGMGTYLFTIVGVVLMACAAGAFFMSRRKTQE